MKPLLVFFQCFLFSIFGQAQTDPCSFSCDQNCKNYSDQLEFRLNQIQRNCGFPSNPGGNPGTRLEFFNSDTCSGDLIGTATSVTNCDKFKGASRTWAVRFNGRCEDVADMETVDACYAMKSVSQINAVLFYNSDNCSSSLIAAAAAGDDCKSIAKHVSTRVWAVKIAGQCQDISDTDFQSACDRFSLLNRPNSNK